MSNYVNQHHFVFVHRFYMYLDCDSGTLALGSDHAFWGAHIMFPLKALPVYPMLGVSVEGAQVAISYKGSGEGNISIISVV